MTYTLPVLWYEYHALEPHIDTTTMEIHHTKHHQTYIDKLNAAIAWTERAEKSLVEVIQSIDILPSAIKGAVRNNGWGHWNHTFFWQCLTPHQTQPSESLLSAINASFWSFDTFKDRYNTAALSVFGSWRVWLVKEYDELIIKTTANQDSPLMVWEKAILWIDIWEHAYYLKNQNRRADYLTNIWNVINREFVSQQFDKKY